MLFWAISLYLSFMLGSKKFFKKRKARIKRKEDSLKIKQLKKAEKEFWYYDGTVKEKT